jgi:hypothetical protein
VGERNHAKTVGALANRSVTNVVAVASINKLFVFFSFIFQHEEEGEEDLRYVPLFFTSPFAIPFTLPSPKIHCLFVVFFKFKIQNQTQHHKHT